PKRRKRLNDNAAYLRSRFTEMNLDIGNSTTQIIPVILGDSAKALEVSQKLYDSGFLLSAIRPPTVPQGTARLRVSVQANHTLRQLDGLCENLKNIC
ncbi:MAG: aminotransferase class I/II-fold pyridoxal phosphate-dependent enzyme, partial [Planctomycetota bacterium]